MREIEQSLYAERGAILEALEESRGMLWEGTECPGFRAELDSLAELWESVNGKVERDIQRSVCFRLKLTNFILIWIIFL